MQLPRVGTNPHWTGYACGLCGRAHPTDHRGFVCAACGDEGILDATYDHAAIRDGLPDGDPFPARGRPDLWRYAALLPLRPEAPHACWSLGDTPLHAPHRLREHLGLPHLLLKDDTALPSASLKDRATAMAMADCARLGVAHVAAASTGNAAASLAVLAARAGVRTTIFVPAAAPRAKLAQLELHGAEVRRIDGTYDEAFDLSVRETREHDWYSRNCAYNPLLVEGKKTCALEIAHALDFRAPDAVFVPTGDGCIVSSTAKAFHELAEVGRLDRVPAVFGVQAAGAAPLFRAWREAGARAAALAPREVLAAVTPVTPATIADSISVGVPRNRLKAWKYVSSSGGGFLAVEDEAIREAIRLLARLAGVWAEPSGAAGFAGLMQARAQGLIGPHDKVVALVTGHGLKDPLAGMPFV
jgi:threonine synthase